MRVIFVLALNKRQFDMWASQVRKIFQVTKDDGNSFYTKDARYWLVDSIDKTRGVRADSIIEVGQFYEHSKADEIREYARMSCKPF